MTAYCGTPAQFGDESSAGRIDLLNWPQWDAPKAQQIIESLRHKQGATLPILHGLQEHFGYVDQRAIPLIADALNVSKAEIHGVISFYHDFRTAAPPACVVKLCRAEACQSTGCEDLVAHLADCHGLVPDQATAGQPVSIESIYCLGNCALGPAALVNNVPVGRLSRSGVDAIVHEWNRS